VRSHNKVRALFAENKVRFARAEQLWFKSTGTPLPNQFIELSNAQNSCTVQLLLF